MLKLISRMKKIYVMPEIEAYNVQSNNILQSSVKVESGETEGVSGWGDAQSKILSGDISDINFGLSDLEDANNTLLDLLDQ